MSERLKELIGKQLLTLDELTEIEEMENVIVNRVSGMCKHAGYVWYEVILENSDGENYDVYAK